MLFGIWCIIVIPELEANIRFWQPIRIVQQRKEEWRGSVLICKWKIVLFGCVCLLLLMMMLGVRINQQCLVCSPELHKSYWLAYRALRRRRGWSEGSGGLHFLSLILSFFHAFFLSFSPASRLKSIGTVKTTSTSRCTAAHAPHRYFLLLPVL